jgi:uncharacterized phage infection (PIP) family protein YhgE
MTQEELDALMNGDIDDLEGLEDEVSGDEELDSFLEEEKEMPKAEAASSSHKNKDDDNTPPPPTDENKMVHQLDDVTKESEEKATQIFDIIDEISNDLMEKEEHLNRVIEVLESNIELFTTLSTKFPDVQAFKTQLEKNEDALADATESVQTLQTSGDSIMNVMDIMQYQDIHRQKIERVINVMRALSKYMNTLFEGKIADEKRVSSATHISGDTNTELASTDDIEALLAQFGQ